MWTHYLSLPRPVYVLCLGTFVNRAGSIVIPFLTIYLQESLHMEDEFATRAMGGYGLGALAAAMVGGHLADRIGRRIIMLVALFGAAAVLLLLSKMTAGWAITLVVMLFALLSEMYRPAASAMIADLVAPSQRQYAFGLMYVSINLGFSVAAMAGGWLASMSFAWLFWGDAATAAAYGLIILIFIRETLPAANRSRPETAAPASPPDTARLEQTYSLAEAARYILRDTPFLIFSTASFLLAAVYMQSMSTFPLYLTGFGIAKETYGTIIAINGVMIVFLQLPVTSLISRYDRGTMVCLAAIVTAIGFGLMAVPGSAWWFAFTIMIWTVGEIMHAPLMSAIVTDLAPVELRARYLGVASMTFSSALMIAAPLGGMVLHRLGGVYVWIFASGLALTAATMFFAIRTRIAVRSDPEGPRDPAPPQTPSTAANEGKANARPP